MLGRNARTRSDLGRVGPTAISVSPFFRLVSSDLFSKWQIVQEVGYPIGNEREQRFCNGLFRQLILPVRLRVEVSDGPHLLLEVE